MKKSTKIAAFLFLCLMTITSTYAQETIISSTSEERTITIYDYSTERTIDLEVFEGTNFFTLKVESSINYGSLKVEIYNPSGKKQGQFSVKSISTLEETKLREPGSKNYIAETVVGRINKTFSMTKAGVWKIKIYPKKASGIITVTSAQSKK